MPARRDLTAIEGRLRNQLPSPLPSRRKLVRRLQDAIPVDPLELPPQASEAIECDIGDLWIRVTSGSANLEMLIDQLAAIDPARVESFEDEVFFDLRRFGETQIDILRDSTDIIVRAAVMSSQLDVVKSVAVLRGATRLALSASPPAIRLRTALGKPSPLGGNQPVPLIPGSLAISCIAGIVHAARDYGRALAAAAAADAAAHDNEPVSDADGIERIEPTKGRVGDQVRIIGNYVFDKDRDQVIFTSYNGDPLVAEVTDPAPGNVEVVVPSRVGRGPVGFARYPRGIIPPTVSTLPSANTLTGQITACLGPIAGTIAEFPAVLVSQVGIDPPPHGSGNNFQGGPFLDDKNYVGHVGQTIEMFGGGFMDGDRVRVGQTIVTADVQGSARISFAVPDIAGVQWPVEVVGPRPEAGEILAISNTVTMRILPHVESIEPPSAWRGDTVTLRGNGFSEGLRLDSTDYLGSLPALDYVSAHEVRFTVQPDNEPANSAYPSGVADFRLNVKAADPGDARPFRLHRVASRAGARRFAPQVNLHYDETHFPASIDWFLSQCELWINLYDVAQGAKASWTELALAGLSAKVVERGSLTRHNLPDLFFGGISSYGTYHREPAAALYWLKPTEAARTGMKKAFSGGRPGPNAYVHIRPIGDDIVDFQYWMFYPYSGPISPFWGAHDGDWEHVTVRVAGSRVLGVFLSAHETSESHWRGADALAWAKDDQGYDHSVVYSARESHAAYELAGTQHRSLANDETSDNGYSWRLWTGDGPEVIDNQTRWAFYQGYWGDPPTIGALPPRSPGLKQAWYVEPPGPPNAICGFDDSGGKGEIVWAAKARTQIARSAENDFTNDQIKSLVLMTVARGTVIDLYNDSDGDASKGWTRIKVNALRSDIVIPRLDRSYSNTTVDVVTNTEAPNGMGEIQGKVSRIVVSEPLT